jgi:hypothetical protein
MADVPGTPTTLASVNATALRKVLFNNKLRQPDVLPSIFTNLMGQAKVIDKKIIIEKTGIVTTINADQSGPENVHRLAMVKPYSSAPIFGSTTSKLGSEEGDDLLYCDLYWNEVFKAFKRWGFGINFNETAYLKLAQTNMPRLLLYLAEMYDWRCHEALLLQGDPALVADPVNYVQQFTPNWLIPNLLESSFPAYDLDKPTPTAGAVDSAGYYPSKYYAGATSFAETIAVALLAASGTGSTPLNLLTGDFVQFVVNYARSVLQIPPIPLDGMPTTVITIPTRVKNWFLNKDNSGSVGTLITNKAAYQQNRGDLIIPNELGRLIDQNVLLVEDMRGSTLTVGGAEGAYTLTPGFMRPGNNDDRNMADWSNTSGDTNFVFDLCHVLGAEALFHMKVDSTNTKLSETTQYGQIEAKGAYMGDGIQQGIFDKDSASRVGGNSSTRTGIYRGSAIIPVGRTPWVKVSA